MNGEPFALHRDRSEHHGMTLVVDTDGPEIYIGRCDDVTDQEVILMDVDVHRDGDGGRSKGQYVERAAQVGVWKKHDMFVLPRSRVTSIRRLGEI